MPETWADKAKPFLRTIVQDGLAALDAAKIKERLAALTPPQTAEDFLVNTSVAIVKAATNSAWVVQLGEPEIRDAAKARMAELVAIFGSAEEAIVQLAQHDLASILGVFA